MKWKSAESAGDRSFGPSPNFKGVFKSNWLLPVLIGIVGVGLRLTFLFDRMCHDEAETFVMFASKPLSVITSFYPFPNNHIFSNILVHFSTSFFGSSPWAVRLPAFVAGVLVIPATYYATRSLFGRRPALLAAALAAVSWPLISFSSNARGYTIQAVLVALMIVVAVRIKMKNDVASWVSFVAISVLGFYTEPTMLYAFGGITAWIFISALRQDTTAPRGRIIYRLVISMLVTAILVLLLYTPALLRTGLPRQLLNPVSYSLHWNSAIEEYLIRWLGMFGYTTFSVMFSLARKGLLMLLMIAVTSALTVALAYGFTITCIKHRRLCKYKTNLALVVLAWSVIAVFAQGYYPPERVFVPLIPLYFGYAAAGLSFSWSRFRPGFPEPIRRFFTSRAVVFAVVLVLGATVLLAQHPWQQRDMSTMRDAQEMTLRLGGILHPGDVVYMEPVVRKSLEYYFVRSGISLSYLYGTQEFGHRRDLSPGRRFIIQDDYDGVPLEKTIAWAKLPSRKRLTLKPVACCDYSTAFLINASTNRSQEKGDGLAVR